MKKPPNIIFHAVSGLLLSLFLMCGANASTTTKTVGCQSIDYFDFHSDKFVNVSDIYLQRRLFQWTPEKFINSFKNYVAIEFIAGDQKKINCSFGGNLHKEKILIVGGGLIYDDDVKGATSQFISKSYESYNDRIQYYPFNAYLVDLDGTRMYHGNGSSYSDSSGDIENKETIPSIFTKDQFDIIVFEHIDSYLINQNVLTNILSILKPEGTLIFNCPIELTIKNNIEEIKKDLEQYKSIEIKDVGTICFVPNQILKKSASRFLLHFVPTKEIQLKIQHMNSTELNIELQKHTPQILKNFREVANEWVQQFGFKSLDVTFSSPKYWFSSCCDEGYCLAYKKEK